MWLTETEAPAMIVIEELKNPVVVGKGRFAKPPARPPCFLSTALVSIVSAVFGFRRRAALSIDMAPTLGIF